MKSSKKHKSKDETSSSSSSDSDSSSSTDSSSSNEDSTDSNTSIPSKQKNRSPKNEDNVKKRKRSDSTSKNKKKCDLIKHSLETEEKHKEERVSHNTHRDDKRHTSSNVKDSRDNYHNKETREYHRSEKYKDKDSEKNERRKYRVNRNEDKRSDGDRYRKYRDKEEYYHNRSDYKSNNTRERTRDNDGYRFKNRFSDHRRDNKYSRSRRDRSRSNSFDHANAKWGKSTEEDSKKERAKPVNKEKPNFGLSGKLTEETNTYRGVVIKYSEPPEARKPKRRWRLYPFKGEKALQTLYIHRESAYLIGRDRKVVDLPVDHPSCSKQHAVLQYRLVNFTREDGTSGKRVRPYIIDLESANGTYINNKKIEPKKFVELLEKDVIKFGFSSREYVLLHENSKDEIQDDDVKQENEEVPVKAEPTGNVGVIKEEL